MTLLDAHEMNQVVHELTYRPGWTLEVLEDPYEGPFFRVAAMLENSYGGSPTPIRVDSYLSPNDRQDRRAFLNFVVWRLIRIESHEAREWLRDRVTKEPITDPHEDEHGTILDVFTVRQAERAAER